MNRVVDVRRNWIEGSVGHEGSPATGEALTRFPRPSVVDLLFEIPGGGLLTRFCYVAYGNRDRASWPVVVGSVDFGQ